jgi:quinol monooxygenase YgiN
MSAATCAVCVTFQIHPEFIESFLEAVRQQARNSLEKEPWCHQFDVSVMPDQPNLVLLYETYDDRAAFFEKHRTTEHFAEFTAKITDWVAEKQVGVWDILP